MKNYAVEFNSPTKSFENRYDIIPPLEFGQVLIQVTCCTICGSDLHTFCGRRDAPSNCVLGHEIVGKVVAWGGARSPKDYYGQDLYVGERVTWAMAVGCGACFYCKNNLSQKCVSLFKYGHSSGGKGVPTGGLSQHCILIAGTAVFPIPDSLSDEVACPANCATATVSAAMRLIAETHRIEGSTAMIVGAGMLGLTAAAQLCEAGADRIVVADIDSERLSLATRFGATHCVDSTKPESVQATLETITDGRGVDIALDFAGVLSAVEMSIESIREGGCLLLAGSVFATPDLSIAPETIVRRMLTIRGLHNYLASDLDHGLSFLNRVQDRFPFRDLVRRTFTLEQTQQAFEFARDQRPVRIAVRDVGSDET